MKSKIILLFIISLLLQSCTTYITINEKNTGFQKGKFYKIMQNKKYSKGTLTNFNEETLTIKYFEKETIIDKSAIEKMKVRKFDVVKTIVLVPVVIIGVSIISFIADPDINLGN